MRERQFEFRGKKPCVLGASFEESRERLVLYPVGLRMLVNGLICVCDKASEYVQLFFVFL